MPAGPASGPNDHCGDDVADLIAEMGDDEDEGEEDNQ